MSRDINNKNTIPIQKFTVKIIQEIKLFKETDNSLDYV